MFAKPQNAALVVLASLVTSLVACGQGGEATSSDAAVVDASTASLSTAARDPAGAIADGVVQTLKPAPDLAARFAPDQHGLLRDKDGVTSPGWRGAGLEPAYRVGARLPETASEPFVAGIGVSESYRLTLEHVGARGAPIAMNEGRAVYHDAYPSVDVTYAATPDRLEWAYTLRDDKAPARFDLRVALSSNLTAVRAGAAGSLEFVDARSNVLLRMPEPVAIDAKGVRRSVPLAWDGKQISFTLDRTGLEFPIVLDPAIETAVWQPRVQTPSARVSASAAYDSTRKKIVVFGGFSGTSLSDTWEFDGIVWALRATAGPSARTNAALAFDVARGETVLFGGSNGGAETWVWNGTAWIQRCTAACTPPSGRTGAAMVYDAARANVVLFGGNSFGTPQKDTWLWNGTTWTAGPAGPSPRFDHGMTWDASLNRVLLFGGDTGSGKLNDLWSFNGTAWTALSPLGTPPAARSQMPFLFRNNAGRAIVWAGADGTGSVLADAFEYTSSTNTWSSFGGTLPSRRYGHAGAFDITRSVAVFFGGQWGPNNGETWQFDGATFARPAGDVGERFSPATAYDSYRNRVVLFSGGNAPPYTNDTWEWTGFNWTRVCTTAPCSSTLPTGRVSAGSAYDSARRRWVLFGGNNSSDLGDTWEYDGSAWTQMCTVAPCSSTRPSARSDAAMAFDSGRSRTVLFGGTVGPQETWEWTGSAWVQMCTGGVCGTLPAGREGAAMTYDPNRGRIVMFGGKDSATSALRNDTWEYTGSAWIQVSLAGPSVREFSKLAYDSVRKKTVLFGGRNGGTYYNDTWEWNGSAWTQTASSGPPGRAYHAMEFDAMRRRVVAYGGGAGALLGDTWEYYTRGGACTVGTQCATGYCVDGVCCEQVSCGTCQACDQASAPGLCSNVISADDPDSCPAASSSCDVQGQCKKKSGQSCGAASECASGSCQDGFCCSSACNGGCDRCDATPGTCTLLADGATGSGCGAYFCNGTSGACPTTCASDVDCAAGSFCASGGLCLPQRPAGKSCNTDPGGDCATSPCNECTAGNSCKDGYCCSSACTGSCFTCAQSPGNCTAVTSNDDPDTCTGANTCSATGTCKKRNGQSCAVPTDCASGFCADNICCNSACAGGCDECSSNPGKCTIVAQGNPGASPACLSFVCNGSLASCPTTCANDSDCASTYYCASDATCQPRKANGAACNLAAGGECRTPGCRSCTSNNCVDGFCCNTACGGQCDACNGGALGWASATNGTCALAPASYAGSPACSAFACNGASAACATSCTSDSQCASGFYCNAAGTCVAQKTQGLACNLATDCRVSGSCRACSTGNCVDGYCCNSGCTGQCQACDVSGALGSCLTVTGAVHGTRAACAGSGSCAATCNGSDPLACKYVGASVACGTTSCTAGAQTNVGTCNGAGTCSQSTTSCGNYVCGTTTCKSSCTADTDCSSSTLYCSGTSCVPKQPNGNTCSANNACSSGFCVIVAPATTGVCCDKACSTSGLSCTIAGSVGTCAKINGQACTSPTECGTGNCVDNVCCDTTCGGQCQACNVAGNVGKCTNVIGAPVAPRSACGGIGAGTTCGQRCDGTSATVCAYPTGLTSCSAASCSGGVAYAAGSCETGLCKIGSTPCAAYTCGATACKTTCAADTDCAGGFYCKVGLCAPKETLGGACLGATACASGNCVDGVCCSTGTCSSGMRCNVPLSVGTCAKPNGGACSVSTECASKFCVDGVCCDTGCTGQCMACDTTGKVGTCSGVNGSPHGSRSSCAGAGAGTECGPTCIAAISTASCSYPSASSSCGANTCTSTGGNFIEKHTSVCDGKGACSDEPKTCVGYACNTTACKTSCTVKADCATGFYCKFGTDPTVLVGSCVPIEGLGTSCSSAATCTSGFCTDGVCCAVGSCGAGRSCSAGTGSLKGLCASLNGTECSADGECASGRCVDGVCCDVPCDGSCEACNSPGNLGKCVPVVGNPRTGHPACTGTSTDSDCAARCDGTDGAKCKYPGTTTTCGKPSCGGGIESPISTCDGAGTCKPAAKTCSPYVCGPTACLAACTKNDDCGAGNYCKTGSCVKVEALGKDCTTNAECASGFCADNVCCSVSSCGEGASCARADSTTPGVCLKKKGVTCAKADDCASGRCVDGYCCDLACDGQCEACDVKGSEGSCTPVVGAPHAARAACDSLADKDCAKAQCNGKARDKCDGFTNGGTTECGVASCTADKRYQKSGACDGAGKCAMPDPKPCTPYACDATASTGCKSACGSDDDCAAEYKCEAGACVQGATCSADGLSSIDKTGASKPCSPYRCGSDGKCMTSCATSSDCASSTVCDVNVKACVGVAAEEGGDGGCGCSTPGNRPDGSRWALLGLVALAAVRLRARRGGGSADRV